MFFIFVHDEKNKKENSGKAFLFRLLSEEISFKFKKIQRITEYICIAHSFCWNIQFCSILIYNLFNERSNNMGPDFYETRGGRQFIDGTMPRIAKALERIADALEAQNKELIRSSETDTSVSGDADN